MAKTILEALNELVEKQGGTTEDNKLIVDAINDLVETGGGGGVQKVCIRTFEQETAFTVNAGKVNIITTRASSSLPMFTIYDENGDEATMPTEEDYTFAVITGVTGNGFRASGTLPQINLSAFNFVDASPGHPCAFNVTVYNSSSSTVTVPEYTVSGAITFYK